MFRKRASIHLDSPTEGAATFRKISGIDHDPKDDKESIANKLERKVKKNRQGRGVESLRRMPFRQIRIVLAEKQAPRVGIAKVNENIVREAPKVPH